MSKPVLRPRPSLMLLLLTCVLAMSACGKSGPVVRPDYCPKPSPPPSSVMRLPQAEKQLRAELFESAETPTTSSPPAKP